MSRSYAVFRVSDLPFDVTTKDLEVALAVDGIENKIQISICPSFSNPEAKIALVSFEKGPPPYLESVSKGQEDQWQKNVKIGGSFHDITIDNTFYGLTQLYAPRYKSKVTMDIVAVTGLAGHAFGSWRGKGTLRKMWLKDFLQDDLGLPDCRTMIYGYDSSLKSYGVHGVGDYATDLIMELRMARKSPEARTRPTIFIGHSFGGIIISQTLVKLKNFDPVVDPVAHGVYKSTCGALFFGTPHRGFDIENILTVVDQSNYKERGDLVNFLRPDSEDLKKILREFLALDVLDRIKIVSFYEMMKSQQIVKGEKGFQRTGGHVLSVSRESAVLEVKGEEPLPADADHTQIVKFNNPSNSTYASALYWMKQIEETKASGKSTTEGDTQTEPGRASMGQSAQNPIPSSGISQEIASYAVKNGNIDALKKLRQLNVLNPENVNAAQEGGTTLLHMAVGAKAHNKEIIELLLGTGADVMAVSTEEITPVVLAALVGRKDLMEVLLKGSDINRKGSQGMTHLLWAVKGGHEGAAKVLLDMMADIEAKNLDGSTPLDLAILRGNNNMAKLLLDNKASINTRDRKGWTLLHSAVWGGHPSVVKMLLERGVDVGSRDTDKDSPLHLAAYGGHDEILEMLLKHNADIESQGSKGTPLHRAVDGGNNEVFGSLLGHGADVAAQDPNNSTTLHRAAAQGNLMLVEMLLECPVNIDLQDSNGCTALHDAAAGGHTQIVEALLTSGAKVNLKTKAQYTALDLAAINGSVETVDLLLEHGAIGGTSGHIPEFLAAKEGHDDLMLLFVDRGYKINDKGAEETPMLHCAAQGGYTSLATFLLDQGADITAKNSSGSTPLHIAAAEGNTSLVELFLSYGADTTATDKDGNTPLQCAKSHSHTAVVEILHQHDKAKHNTQGQRIVQLKMSP